LVLVSLFYFKDSLYKKIFSRKVSRLGLAEKVCWWGEESVAGRGRERQKARVWNYTREGLSPFPDGLSKR
jgi:hypothetical protein